MSLSSFSVLSGVVLLLLITSCGSDTLQKGDHQIFRYNLTTPVSSLDPAFARNQSNIWASSHLYNGLLSTDTLLQYTPSLAKSWKISDDGLTYTFILRDDVYFHDNACFPEGKGRRFVASDVVYSFRRLLNPGLSAPGSWVFSGRLADTDALQAPNDTTFIMQLNRPFRPMLGILTMPYCFIVSYEAVEYYGDRFRANPVGTGPFKLVRWVENEVLLLRRNSNYFETDDTGQSLPYLDGIRAQFISDRYTAFIELKQGNLDFISGLDATFTHEALTPAGELQSTLSQTMYLQKGPFLNMEYIGFGLEYWHSLDSVHPMLNPKVRQALNYGINREQMLRTFRMNIGKAADRGFIPRGLPEYAGADYQGYHFNPEKAARLLREAGYPNGVGIPMLTLHTNSDYLDIITYVARQWENIGIRARIEVMESATLRELMTRRGVGLFRGSWIADYPDAETYLTVFYGPNPAPPNYTGFNEEAYNELYRKALVASDDSLRTTMHHTMNRIVIDDAPVIFLYYDETTRFVSNRVSGLPYHAFNYLDLRRVTIR